LQSSGIAEFFIPVAMGIKNPSCEIPQKGCLFMLVRIPTVSYYSAVPSFPYFSFFVGHFSVSSPMFSCMQAVCRHCPDLPVRQEVVALQEALSERPDMLWCKMHGMYLEYA
jgi:hypothetical protein